MTPAVPQPVGLEPTAVHAGGESAPLEPPQPAPPPAWSLASRLAFRFACAYVCLYGFSLLMESLPSGDLVSRFLNDQVWHVVVPWLGKHVLRLGADITTFQNGSGDTTYNYVQLLLYLTLAGAVTAAWSVWDWRRPQYVKAHDVLRTLVRYVLAAAMLSYGMAKVIKLQFPAPSPGRLMEPLGELSPMGLLWTFMGYSTGYNLFTGSAEVLGGLLLFSRRTTTLGALVVVGVMSNVVALNFFYDVPVKIYSSHLLLFAVLLLLPDLRRLADVLVLNRATRAVALAPPFVFSARETWGLRGLKLLVVGWLVWTNVGEALDFRTQYGEAAPKPPLYGLYEVESVPSEGQAPALMLREGPLPWRYVAVVLRNRVWVRTVGDAMLRFTAEMDPQAQSLVLRDGSGPTATSLSFHYTVMDAEHLLMVGTVRDTPIAVRLRKVDESRFLLVSRGFNWIQETPFNR
ncbi:hypothetical protein KRR26_06880 [Corallococcus sp. M34]|uniref:hypothetical protein n=1 Tax=Citreicoccus inhibens TaxID=2849499 RepID=UPI001C250E27|nr:hypothetical protein [Citreicoccus inhibens]MBU8895322.1 hypothetical protein [Citreicoccus inhibens]